MSNLTLLEELSLKWGGADPFDFTPLAGLTHLQVLRLDLSGVGDLRLLGNMTGLRELYVSVDSPRHPLSDISFLSPLTELRDLWLFGNSGNKITDIGPIAELTQLENLQIGNHAIKDVEPLKDLVNLRVLYLSSIFRPSQIREIHPLQTLTNLQWLALSGNPISDVSPLQTLTNLQRLWLSGDAISDISPLQTLTNLQWFSLENTQVSDISALKHFTDLRFLKLERNQIEDISPLGKLGRLGELPVQQPIRRWFGEHGFDWFGRTKWSYISMRGFLRLSANRIADISPLVENPAIRRRHGRDYDPAAGANRVELRGNLLNAKAYDAHIPALESRGVRIDANPRPSGVTLDFADRNLEQAIRRRSGIPDRPIYESDVEALKSLNADGITDLSGIGHCINLTSLTLLNLNTSDIRPLSQLSKLNSLWLVGSGCSNLNVLASLTKLNSLYLDANGISDIRPLSHLTRLETLSLKGNKLEDISPLTHLKSLSRLNLDSNRLNNVEALATLRSLTHVYLSHNEISNVRPLAGHAHLDVVNLTGNRIRDIAPFVESEVFMSKSVSGSLVLRRNPLNGEARSLHIPQLQERGIRVSFDASP